MSDQSTTNRGKLWIFRKPVYAGQVATLTVRVTNLTTFQVVAEVTLVNLQDPQEIDLDIGTKYKVTSKENPGCFLQGNALELSSPRSRNQ